MDAGDVGPVTINSQARFDGFVYTLGWDEWDGQITGWGSSVSQTPDKGKWVVSEQGLTAIPDGSYAQAFKGDLLPEYEFSTQVTFDQDRSHKESAGIYAVYIDQNNWLKGDIAPGDNMFDITARLGGADINSRRVCLPRRWLVKTSQSEARAYLCQNSRTAMAGETTTFAL